MTRCLIVLCVVAPLMLSGCGGTNVEILKSPCVGLDDSPCGPKRPVNDWWLKQKQHVAYHALA